MQSISIVIPSLNPDEKLIEVVESIISRGFESIIIVNDGSDKEYDKYFDLTKKHKGCVVLKHCKNLGKGRALKTAFNYFINTYSDNIGLITVDADNQHYIDDICNCAIALQERSNSLILGSRNFDLNNVPLKSKFGNKITKFIFKSLCGINLSDTQTGLRAIPTSLVKEFIDIDGERYEFETNMLIEAKLRNVKIEEVKIQTIYIENNKSSHFNPLRDSFKIYLLIFKFCSVSFLSSIIDLGLFALFMLLFKGFDLSTKIFLSTALSRILSSLFNFYINKNVVFNNGSNTKTTMVKYYTLAVIQMSLSYLGVYLLSKILHFNSTAIKLFVDIVLFALSFQIQREWVFKSF